VAPGEVGRPAAHWDDFFDAPDWMDSDPRRRFYAVHEGEGGADGYVSYEVSPHPNDPRSRLVDLHELVALSDGVYASLWSFVLGVDLTTAVRTRRRPLDEPLRFMLDDPRQLRTASVHDTLWVRFVDARRALEARRWAREGRLVLELVDDFCPWVAGRYVIEAAGDGSAAVEGPLAADAVSPGGAAPLRADLTLGSSSLATAYFGEVSVATLARAGRAVENIAGSAVRADEMLACRPPAFCTMGF
jgi:predicted acetyltransferase